MSLGLRILFSVLTAITLVACLVFAIIGFVKAVPILSITSLLLAFGFSVPLYRDVQYYISRKK